MRVCHRRRAGPGTARPPRTGTPVGPSKTGRPCLAWISPGLGSTSGTRARTSARGPLPPTAPHNPWRSGRARSGTGKPVPRAPSAGPANHRRGALVAAPGAGSPRRLPGRQARGPEAAKASPRESIAEAARATPRAPHHPRREGDASSAACASRAPSSRSAGCRGRASREPPTAPRSGARSAPRNLR